ncbi:MAG: GH85 family endohexosaminidase C-terminal domain-containing protein, partial [Oscillospiraceae bacterium]
FNWDYGSQIDNSKATAESVGRSPFDVYAGLDTQTNSYNTSRFNHSKIFGKGTAKTSLGFYTMSSTLAMSVTPEDFYRNEQIFWVGANGDPTNTASNSTGPSNWKGMAHHYADKSVINDLPFSTNFNTGHGKKYFIDGELSRNKEWSNRSAQDILPTWRWDIESEGSKLTADFDFDDAYYGGNSIKLSGSLDANKANVIKLYSTDLVMNSNVKASVTYKTPADATNLKVGFAINASLEDATYDNYDFVYYDLPAGTPGEWTTTEITLGEQYLGKHITAVSLKAESSSDVKDYEVNIGNISISEFDAEPAQMGKVSNPEIDDVLFHDARTAEVKMIWDKAEGDVMYYEIYRVHANGSKEYVGTTTRDAYYIPEVIRDGSEDYFNFEIVPVDAMYNHGQATTLRFDWDLPLSATEENVVEEPVNLAYLKPTDASAWYDAEPPAKAVDGTAKNGSKWCTGAVRGTWMTVDLGQVETIERWAVWHANHPDAKESPDMNTRDFRLQVQKGDGTFEDVDVVTGNKDAITDRNLAEPVEGQVFRLYIDYAHNGSQWGATRIYEFQLFEKPLLGTKTEANIPENIVAVNNEGANDTVTVRGVTAGQTINLYTSLESKEAIASKVADGSTVVFEGLDLGAEAGYVYMTQTSPDLIESIKIGSAYEAEGLATLAKPNVKIVNNGAAKFSEISVLNLKAGDVVKVYNTMDDTFAAVSVTVPYGADMANIRNQVLNAEGGELIMELVRAGSGTTGKFTVAYNDKGTVDPENPAPVITGAPESGASRTPVTLTADKNVKFVINGVTDEDYRTSVTLKDEGVYTVKAIDENGVESDEITFAIDRTAPVLTADCEHYGVTNKDVTFSTNETVTFMVNGVEKNTGTELVLNESGVYTVYAMDAAGNRSAIYRVTIQKSAPELTLTGVEDNGVTRNNVSIRSNNRVTYYVNDEFAGDFVFGLKVVEEGSYTVKAVDLAGNRAL